MEIEFLGYTLYTFSLFMWTFWLFMCFLEDLYGGRLLIWVVLLMTVSCFCESADGLTEWTHHLSVSTKRKLLKPEGIDWTSLLLILTIAHPQAVGVRTAELKCMGKKSERLKRRQTGWERDRQTDRTKTLVLCTSKSMVNGNWGRGSSGTRDFLKRRYQYV